MNRELGAESTSLLVLRDSEYLPGVGGFEGDGDELREELDDDEEEEDEDEDEVSAFFFFYLLFFFLPCPCILWDYFITLLAASYDISLGGQFFPSFGLRPFDWNWYGSHLPCGSQGLFSCSMHSIVPCSCGNSTI